MKGKGREKRKGALATKGKGERARGERQARKGPRMTCSLRLRARMCVCERNETSSWLDSSPNLRYQFMWLCLEASCAHIDNLFYVIYVDLRWKDCLVRAQNTQRHPLGVFDKCGLSSASIFNVNHRKSHKTNYNFEHTKLPGIPT